LIVIGLMGKAGVGKDTTAFRMEKLTPSLQKESFAARFKPFVQQVFGFTFDQVYGDKKEQRDMRGVLPAYWVACSLRLNGRANEWLCSLGLDPDVNPYARRALFSWFHGIAAAALDNAFSFTPRRVMQTLGTEWGRAIDPDLWAKATMAKIKRLNNLAGVVAITDCRFVNELEAIRAAGGQVWKIQGTTITDQTGHASEKEMDQIPLTHFDHVVRNDKTKPIETLDEQITLGLLKANLK
jgi:hypothetical protein